MELLLFVNANFLQLWFYVVVNFKLFLRQVPASARSHFTLTVRSQWAVSFLPHCSFSLRGLTSPSLFDPTGRSHFTLTVRSHCAVALDPHCSHIQCICLENALDRELKILFQWMADHGYFSGKKNRKMVCPLLRDAANVDDFIDDWRPTCPSDFERLDMTLIVLTRS